MRLKALPIANPTVIKQHWSPMVATGHDSKCTTRARIDSRWRRGADIAVEKKMDFKEDGPWRATKLAKFIAERGGICRFLKWRAPFKSRYADAQLVLHGDGFGELVNPDKLAGSVQEWVRGCSVGVAWRRRRGTGKLPVRSMHP